MISLLMFDTKTDNFGELAQETDESQLLDFIQAKREPEIVEF